MVPFGPFRPDAESINSKLCVDARNVYPAVQGFRPVSSPQAVSDALGQACSGAVSVILADGSTSSFAGDKTKLYKLGSSTTWADVSRTTGGAYATATGERWRFDTFGTNLIATNYTDDVQVYTIGSSSNFSALGGSPPKARYIAVVREFVFLGGLFGNELRLQWSGIGNSTQWTPGSNSSDYQDFPSGGPIRGLIGGEVGYVFQDQKITRATFVPGSAEIFQFDEVSGGRGLKAPSSLVRLDREAFYYAGDGFYRLDLGGASSAPIGVGKWVNWFRNDLRAGTEGSILGAVDPRQGVIMWAYISRSNATTTPDRILIYDWKIDEASYANVSVEAIAQWLTQGYTLDTMNSFGKLDALPYSLDSPFWKGGAQILGLFGTDHKLAYLQGSPMEAQVETADGQTEQRVLIKGVRPHVDTSSATVSVAMTERDGDAPAFLNAEAMEDTGVCPQWASGNLARARVTVPAGATWTYLKGLETVLGTRGKR